MDTKTRLKRIALYTPAAIALVIYSISTDGWEATLAPIRIFLVGGIALVTLFKFLGLM